MEAAGGSLYFSLDIWGTLSSLLTVLINMANYQSTNGVGELNFASVYEAQCLDVNNTGTRGFTYVFAPGFNFFQCGACKVWMISCRMGIHMLKRNNVEGIWVPCCKKLAEWNSLLDEADTLVYNQVNPANLVEAIVLSSQKNKIQQKKEN